MTIQLITLSVATSLFTLSAQVPRDPTLSSRPPIQLTGSRTLIWTPLHTDIDRYWWVRQPASGQMKVGKMIVSIEASGRYFPRGPAFTEQWRLTRIEPKIPMLQTHHQKSVFLRVGVGINLPAFPYLFR